MKKVLSWFGILLSPFFIGLIVTCVIIFISFRFYTIRSSPESMAEQYDQSSFVQKILLTTHQKTIDFRLLIRGPRKVDKDLALLTVDDKALATIGRWPWSRDKMAFAVDQAMKLGAKVLAFDIVFSEPTENESLRQLKKIYTKGLLPPAQRQDLKQFLDQSDDDGALGKVVKTYSNSLVMGTFARISTRIGNYFQRACDRLIFQQTDQYAIWLNDEYTIPVINRYASQKELDFPSSIAALYGEQLRVIKEQVESAMAVAKNSLEKVQITSAIRNEQLTFCDNFLIEGQDELFPLLTEHWNMIKSQEQGGLDRFENFPAWVNHFKTNYLPNTSMVAEDWTMNIPAISANTQHTGYFNTELDPDGTIRRKSMVMEAGDLMVPSLAFRTFLLSRKYSAQFELNEYINSVSVQNFNITNDDGETLFQVPVDIKAQLTINYAGPRQMYPYVSMSELFTDDDTMIYTQRVLDHDSKKYEVRSFKINKKKFFKGKTFIVGVSAVGVFDLRVTPFDENFPGAEIHLNKIDNLLNQDFISSHPEEEKWMLLLLAILGILLSIAITKAGALSSMALTISLLGGAIYVDQVYLFEQGIITVITFPTLLILGLYTGLTVYKYFTEERNKKELRSTFQKYVSPAIVEEILSDPTNIELGGRKTDLTVFFSDIRGFTTISEKLDPKTLSDLLNSYLTPMTDLVFSNKGTLDKYMGDAVMAFFGAPIEDLEHAKHACRCALQSLEKLSELQETYRQKGLPQIDIGIGLNTGECSVGNMGSETVRNYTVMGDTVNLGSRLEGINKQYGTRIIVSEFTQSFLGTEFITREIDWVRVKGKALPVRIFELVAESNSLEIPSEMLKCFEEGYLLYHSQTWNKAVDAFSKALDVNPADPVSKLFLNRCQKFQQSPPPSDWDGVFTMTTK